MPYSGDDNNDWILDADIDNEEEPIKLVAIPPLLPVPGELALPGDKLCDVCSALDLRANRFVVEPSDNKKFNRLDNPNINLGFVGQLLKKVHCPFCRLVVTALGGREIPAYEDGMPVSVVMGWTTAGKVPDVNQPWRHIPQIRLLRPYAQTKGGGYVRSTRLNLFPEITLLANDAPSTSKSFFVRPIKENQIDFGLVKNWLSMCENWHGETCNKSKMPDHDTTSPANHIPSFRLIDVIDNCVVHGPKGCKYVALSYVRGKVRFLRSVKSNIDTLERPGGLMLPEFYEQLPTTILDAMQVVRELELRYLWVDSLCIIQDDDTGGKEDGISKMDLIYGCAFLTIMAATGDDANAGLPGVRPGTRGEQQPIEEIMPGLRLAFKPLYQNYIKDAAYYTRAWTFPEQLFAKRSLVFIGGQVVFRCSRADQWREDVVFEEEDIVNGEHPRSEPNHDDIGNFEGLIQSYSKLSLTYESDIYNAFSGIQRYLKSALNVNMCHGIPDAFFDWFLLWYPLHPQVRRQGTPSWSWSGWVGESSPRMWDWYSRSIKSIQKAQRKRTWIMWYQRDSNDSTNCTLLWTPNKESLSPCSRRNFYGSRTRKRFPLDCTETAPTPRLLVDAPEYYKDHYPTPGSGFLQFWTVSVNFKIDVPISKAKARGPGNKLPRVGFFGRNGYEVGEAIVSKSWRVKNIGREHEFILLCEGRDKGADHGRVDEEEGWRYMVMLIEWHGEWAERIAIGSIAKEDLGEALGEGPVWKEIILG